MAVALLGAWSKSTETSTSLNNPLAHLIISERPAKVTQESQVQVSYLPFPLSSTICSNPFGGIEPPPLKLQSYLDTNSLMMTEFDTLLWENSEGNFDAN
jgi:hypothetical protein